MSVNTGKKGEESEGKSVDSEKPKIVDVFPCYEKERWDGIVPEGMILIPSNLTPIFFILKGVPEHSSLKQIHLQCVDNNVRILTETCNSFLCIPVAKNCMVVQVVLPKEPIICKLVTLHFSDGLMVSKRIMIGVDESTDHVSMMLVTRVISASMRLSLGLFPWVHFCTVLDYEWKYQWDQLAKRYNLKVVPMPVIWHKIDHINPGGLKTSQDLILWIQIIHQRVKITDAYLRAEQFVDKITPADTGAANADE